jgi:hypothetical protein
MSDDTPSPLNNVITIDDERIKSHLDRVVRGSVEETLNALLEAEADQLCNAQRYERSEARRDTRAGYYERKLQTKAGESPATYANGVLTPRSLMRFILAWLKTFCVLTDSAPLRFLARVQRAPHT